MQSNFSAAEAAVKKAIELNPNHMYAYKLYRDVLSDLGRWRDARAILEQALEIDPLSIETIQRLNYLLIFTGPFEEFQALYPEALSWYGHLDVAIRVQKGIVKWESDNSLTHVSLAVLYTDLGEYELAEKSLTRAKELAPEQERIHDRLAEDYLYLAQERYNQYLKFAYDRLSKEPESELFLSMAAFAEMLVGNYEKALAQYEHARLVYKQVGLPFGLSPGAIVWHGKTDLLYMTKAYFKTGNMEAGKKLLAESQAFLAKLREQGLGNPHSYYFEASLNALGGDRQEALASLRKAIDLGWRRSWYARIDPPMESLWDDPEFKEMMVEVERDLAWQRVSGKVYFYSALAIIGLLIAFLIFINRSTSRFACRYRKSINVSMAVCMALGILFAVGAVFDMFRLGEIIYWTSISIVFESNVGWTILGLTLGSELFGMMSIILTCMVLGVGVGMLVGFVRGRRRGVLSE
ncbi:tetratricopeptide repeat protein [Gemmatimonadota bacterium]